MRRTLVLTALALASADRLPAQTVNLWPGPAPGSESWTHQERTVANTPIGAVVLSVVTPTLTAFLPRPGEGTGTGVIIAPGGAFVALAIDLEGTSVARWLQAKGIAAFVLKYRVVEKRQDGIPAMDMDTAGRYGIADGIQAIKLVRQRALDWGISPDRVGFIGFSAGAMVASGTLLQPDSEARPNFDPVALAPIVRFHDGLRSAGHKPEVHIFGAGGHGFGTRKQGTSSDHWMDILYSWLEAQGLTGRTGGSQR